MNTKIAVIVPVYNAEQFLDRCLDSILNQTLQDFKIICVNDASTDNSLDILKRKEKEDNRIIIINHEKNLGSGNARNTALNYIFSNDLDIEYISMVDADDRIESNTFEKAYYEAKKSNADILNYNFLPSTYWEYKTEANSDVVEYRNNCVEAIFDYNEFYTFIVCWSKLYKKELLKNIRFSENKFFEDGGFAYQVYPRAKVLRIIPDTLYEYNIENPQSTCGKMTNNHRLLAILNTIKSTMNDWKKLGIADKYKYEYIDHILLYASLVCPDILDGDYLKELSDCFGFNIKDDIILNNVKEDTKTLIKRMTTTQ